MTSSDYQWEADGEHRLRDMLQEAIFPSLHAPNVAAAIAMTGAELRQAIESIRDNPEVYPRIEDTSYGSPLNPCHPADAEEARIWHGLPEGTAVTRQQLWEWLVGVPRV